MVIASVTPQSRPVIAARPSFRSRDARVAYRSPLQAITKGAWSEQSKRQSCRAVMSHRYGTHLPLVVDYHLKYQMMLYIICAHKSYRGPRVGLYIGSLTGRPTADVEGCCKFIRWSVFCSRRPQSTGKTGITLKYKRATCRVAANGHSVRRDNIAVRNAHLPSKLLLV